MRRRFSLGLLAAMTVGWASGCGESGRDPQQVAADAQKGFDRSANKPPAKPGAPTPKPGKYKPAGGPHL
jgi:hypothetical protein